MCEAEVRHEVDRTHSVGEIRRKIEVSTPLTPTPGHLLFFVVVRKRSVFLESECVVHVETWSQRESRLNFLHPQVRTL